jgi:hypothetical protein
MKLRDTFLTKIAAFVVVLLTSGSAMASTFSGALPTGYADDQFQISEGTSSIMINISAIGARDPAICATCNSIYTDNFIVNLFDQTGTLLKSVNGINYLYFNMFSSSHGIGAGPVGVTVPAGATQLEIVSQLYISGLLGPDGHPLSFGNLNIFTDGSITAATPIPSTLPLLATGLAALGLFSWHRRRKAPGLTAGGASSFARS